MLTWGHTCGVNVATMTSSMSLVLQSSPSEPALSIASSSSKLTALSHSAVALPRRLLFPHLPPSSPLPPLLQTSSTYPALDAELYDLIALALRAYVNPWWTRVTRYDKQLLVELTRILSSILRALEARVLVADLSPLIYHDLPFLITQHCVDYRTAARKVGSSYAAAGSASLSMLFHGQQQHVGVSIDGKLDEEYVRAAIDILLKACLSPEDWDAEAERFLIREVVLKTICVDVAPRITQPWFLHSTVLNLLGPVDDSLRVSVLSSPSMTPIASFDQLYCLLFHSRKNPCVYPLRGADLIVWRELTVSKSPDPPSRLNPNSSLLPSFHTIIVSFLSAVQAISSTALTLIHIYKRTVHTIKRVHKSPLTRTPSRPLETNPPSSPSSPESPPTPGSPSPAASVAASVGSHLSSPDTPLTRAPPHNLARPSLLLLAELLFLPTRFAGAALLFLCDALISVFVSFLDRYVRVPWASWLRTNKRTRPFCPASSHSSFTRPSSPRFKSPAS